MTEQEGRAQLERVLFMVQRCRSMTRESYLKGVGKASDAELDETDESCLEGMDATLWGRNVNLTDAISRVLGKQEIAPIDYYNIAFLAQKSVTLATYAEMHDLPLPEPSLDRLVRGWRKAVEEH
jgi:hypothetical protein